MQVTKTIKAILSCLEILFQISLLGGCRFSTAGLSLTQNDAGNGNNDALGSIDIRSRLDRTVANDDSTSNPFPKDLLPVDGFKGDQTTSRYDQSRSDQLVKKDASPDSGSWVCGKHGSMLPSGWGTKDSSFCDLEAEFFCTLWKCQVHGLMDFANDDYQLCLNRYQMLCLANFTRYSHPNIKVKPEDVLACYQDLAKWSCEDQLAGCSAPACTNLPQGTALTGAPCASDDECQSGRCMIADLTENQCGKCVFPSKIGDPCKLAGMYASDDCEEGLICADFSPDGPGTCKPLSRLGQPCSTQSVCITGTECIDGRCVRYAALDESCSLRENPAVQGKPHCQSYLDCTQGTCKSFTFVNPGGHCDGTKMNPACKGSWCQWRIEGSAAPGKCQAWISDEQDCDPAANQICQPPAQCNSSTNKCEFISYPICE
jgi:hypothetical protein